MAETILKKWAVGDKSFDTYEEAVKYRSAKAKSDIRDELVAIIDSKIDWAYQSGVESAVSAILAEFSVTRKRIKK